MSRIVIAIIALLCVLLQQTPVMAAQLAFAQIRLASHAPTTSPLPVLVLIEPQTAATEAKVALTVGNAWSISSTAADWTVSTSGLPAGVTAVPGISTAQSVSGQVVSFPVSDLNTGTRYGFYITGGITSNPSAGVDSNYLWYLMTQTAASAVIDSTQVMVPVTTPGNIAITGTVPPLSSYFTASIDDSVSSVNENTDIVYTITYGSTYHEGSPIEIQAEWGLGSIAGSGTPTVELVEYVSGSATDAYGSTPAVVDALNRTITWTISSIPANTTAQTVSFTLRSSSIYKGSQSVTTPVSARVLQPAVSADSTVTLTYNYSTPSTPTPTPTATPAPTATPTSSSSDTSSSTPTPTPTPTPNPAGNASPPVVSSSPTQDVTSGSCGAACLNGAMCSSGWCYQGTCRLPLQLKNDSCQSAVTLSATSDVTTPRSITPLSITTDAFSLFITAPGDRVEWWAGSSPDSLQRVAVTNRVPSDGLVVLSSSVLQGSSILQARVISQGSVVWSSDLMAVRIPVVQEPAPHISTCPFNSFFGALLCGKQSVSSEYPVVGTTSDEPIAFRFTLDSPQQWKRLSVWVVPEGNSQGFWVEQTTLDGSTVWGVIPPLAPGKYQLFLRSQTWNNTVYTQFVGSVESTESLLITDESGEEISGALLVLYAWNELQKMWLELPGGAIVPTNPLQSNESGKVLMTLPPGKYKARVQVLGYETQEVEFEIGDGNWQYPRVYLKKLSDTWGFSWWWVAFVTSGLFLLFAWYRRRKP